MSLPVTWGAATLSQMISGGFLAHRGIPDTEASQLGMVHIMGSPPLAGIGTCLSPELLTLGQGVGICSLMINSDLESWSSGSSQSRR